MLTLIVARGLDGGIGRNGEMPWNLPQDLAMFQRETLGGALIMGRATWESLPVKPLKGRFNCVISSNPRIAETVCPDVEAALSLCQSQGYRRVYGIGGSRIYADLLPYADRLVITEVPVRTPDADTWFPDFGEYDWRQVSRTTFGDSGMICTVRELIAKKIR